MDGLNNPEDAVRHAAEVLMASWQDLAGAEALIRALVADRGERKPEALFWIDVYRTLHQQKATETCLPAFFG